MGWAALAVSIPANDFVLSTLRSGTEGDPVLSRYESSLNLGPHYYLQHPDSLSMEGLSGTSFPCSIATLPENFDISMPLSGSGHQGDPSAGPPVAYNLSPSLYLPSMEHPPSVDVNAEWMAWMADLERIPTHNSARNTCTGRPILPEARGSPQTVINEQSLPPEEPLVDTSLISPRIDDTLFTGRIVNPALAPVFMSPLQNDPGLGDFITSMCGSLDDFFMATPLSSQNSFPLSGTPLHS